VCVCVRACVRACVCVCVTRNKLMRPKHDKECFQQSNSHVNLVNLVQNTNELHKNISHSIGSKTPQTISHNYIKIKGIKITGSKT